MSISLLERDGLLHNVAQHHPIADAQARLRALAVSSPLKPGEGISGAVLASGKSVLILKVDATAPAAEAYREVFEDYPLHAVMVAPLRVRGRIIGTVSAFRVREGTYSSADLEMLEGLADRAASSIETSRLHHETERGRARAEQLYRFASAAVSAQKIEDVFDAALDAIAGALGTQRAAILLFDDAGVMRFKAWRELSDAYRRTVEGHSPWSRDAVAPEPILVTDVRVDASLAPYKDLLAREGIGSLAFVPLVTRGRLVGKFMVYFADPHSYALHEIDLATAIANHLASIIARFAATAELERTVRINELFAGVLAHDLRNPLGAMITAAQLLLMRQEGHDESNRKPVSRIMSSGLRMTRMIDQLLDFTRARSGGGIEIQPHDASFADLCKQAVGELELVYPDRNIECTFEGNMFGTWDADRLLQVISNLVSNASQHGSERTISLRVDGRSPEAIRFEIHNSGTIPADLIPTLFDPFRGTQERTRRNDSRGLGLGLFIVQEIVSAHGGTIDVESAEPTGTKFIVCLPRKASAA